MVRNKNWRNDIQTIKIGDSWVLKNKDGLTLLENGSWGTNGTPFKSETELSALRYLVEDADPPFEENDDDDDFLEDDEEDEEYDAVDLETGFSADENWINSSGDIIDINNMAPEYIENCVHLLERTRQRIKDTIAFMHLVNQVGTNDERESARDSIITNNNYLDYINRSLKAFKRRSE